MSWAAQPPTDREALVTSPDPGVLLGPGPPDGQPRLAGGGPRGILGVPLSSRRALWRGKNTFQHLQILKMDFSQGNRDSEPAPFPEREPGKQRGSRGGGGAGASARDEDPGNRRGARESWMQILRASDGCVTRAWDLPSLASAFRFSGVLLAPPSKGCFEDATWRKQFFIFRPFSG